MTRPVIITCALTGGAELSGKNTAVPVTPKEIADSAIEASRAGAAIAYVHVREPGTGKPSMRLELYREVVDRIRQSNPELIINLTTGAGGRLISGKTDPRVPDPASTLANCEKRVEHVLTLNPEICSLASSQFPMVAQAVLLGGNVRVGFEDNLYLRRGVPARSNAELVQEAVRIVDMLGAHVASHSEARAML
jgi:uncharacterized protein (DUF849 family)